MCIDTYTYTYIIYIYISIYLSIMHYNIFYIFICIVVPFLNIYRFLFLRYGITKAPPSTASTSSSTLKSWGCQWQHSAQVWGDPCKNGISSYYWDLTNKNRDLTNLNKSYLDSNGISLGCSWFSPELMCFLVVLGIVYIIVGGFTRISWFLPSWK